MNIKVLGTGSKGNCYLLESKAGKLLLECGINFDEIRKGCDYKMSDILGVLLTHEHVDHKRAYKDILNKGLMIYTSQGTKKHLEVKYDYMVTTIKANEQFKIGDFIILPFETQHDADEPLGFIIYDSISKEKLLFATDTSYLKNKFNNINYYLIECNYCAKTLKNNAYYNNLDQSRYRRTIKTHFSLENLIEFFKANESIATTNVILIHLSDFNSDAKLIQEEIYNVVKVPVHIADKGLSVELKKEIF